MFVCVFVCCYPGAAGARKLAYRAPGAIILGGGCEFVLAFFETHSYYILTLWDHLFVYF